MVYVGVCTVWSQNNISDINNILITLCFKNNVPLWSGDWSLTLSSFENTLNKRERERKAKTLHREKVRASEFVFHTKTHT
jgi:hypothetical protein